MGKTEEPQIFEYEQIEAGLRIVRYIGPADLKEILIPGFSGDQEVLEIGEYAFYHCEGPERIVFAEGVRAIGRGAFALCRNLQTVGLPDSLEWIGQGAFFGCGSAMIYAFNGLNLADGSLCPECEKPITDPVEVCPNCGFGSEGYDLRQHREQRIEKARRQQEQREREEEARKEAIRKEEEARRQQQEAQELKEDQEMTLNLLQMELKKDRPLAVVCSLGFIACLIFTLWLRSENGGLYHIESAAGFVFLLFAALIGDVLLFVGAYFYIRRIRLLNEDIKVAKDDVRKYEARVEERKRQAEEARKKREAEQARMKAEQQAQYAREHPHPKCPMCGGYNTRRITDSERFNSAYWWGLGSDKIGKQYECLDCKHKW